MGNKVISPVYSLLISIWTEKNRLNVILNIKE